MSQEFAEIQQRLWTLTWDLNLVIIPTSVPAMDTIGTGYLVSQIARGPNPPGTVMYVNTAPRQEQREAMNRNAGEKLVWARLKRGVELVAVNSGWSLSLLRDEIEELRWLRVSHRGSQFRSRDFFPQVVADVLHGRHEDRLLREIDPATIPDFPRDVVMWIDGFGNIKTSIRASERTGSSSDAAADPRWREGEKIHITIGDRRATALATGEVFSVDAGELAWSVGSSGHDDPFMEILLRGGSAADLFGRPAAGTPVLLDG